MKKFVLLLLALVGLPSGLMLLSMPGCSNPCSDLLTLCNSDCADTNYQEACLSVARGADQSLCSAKFSGFRSSCAVISNVGGAAPTPASCENGQVLCAGGDGGSGTVCVSLNSNPTYCGACNNDCTKNVAGDDGVAQTKCAAGVCVGSCPAALSDECTTDDGTSCVDTDTDPNNCGACGTVCEGDKPLCSSSGCVAACAEGETECDGACTNLATDLLNCGACSNVCSTSQVCSNGGCASSCADGLTECCGKCVDTSADTDHCGGCVCSDSSGGSGGSGGSPATGEACADGQNCSDGTCVNTCNDPDGNPGCCEEDNPVYDPTKTLCGTACVDPNSNVQHCGACFNLCAEGEKCSSGSCVSGCGTGETECGSVCAKLDTDPNNCGVCGNVCGSSQKCSQGTCKTACDTGLTECPEGSASCVDMLSDPSCCSAGEAADAKNCTKEEGGAGKTKCSKGACEAACDSTLTDCSSHCIDLTKDNFFHCGSCGNSCGDESVCTADFCASLSCSNISAAEQCNDGDPCTKDDCDPKLGCNGDLYSITEWTAICTQLNSSFSVSATQCIMCDRSAETQKAACKNPVTTTSQCGVAKCDGASTLKTYKSASEVVTENSEYEGDASKCNTGFTCCENFSCMANASLCP